MDKNDSIQLFEDRAIRTAWDEENEEWYFSVVDVVLPAIYKRIIWLNDKSNILCQAEGYAEVYRYDEF